MDVSGELAASSAIHFALKMEGARFSEMLVSYRNNTHTQHHNSRRPRLGVGAKLAPFNGGGGGGSKYFFKKYASFIREIF
jgi:hypothetical protein